MGIFEFLNKDKKQDISLSIVKCAQLPQAEYLKTLIKTCGYKKYLELGVYFGTTYNYVKKYCEVAHAVDIEFKDFINKDSFFHMTTDEFFKQNKNMYDLIFIDACHEFGQVKKDFDNSLKVLNPGGVIVLHDTDPYCIEYTAKNRCSDCYKMNNYLSQIKEVNYLTLPMTETGLSLVQRKCDLRHIKFCKD